MTRASVKAFARFSHEGIRLECKWKSGQTGGLPHMDTFPLLVTQIVGRAGNILN